jgi:hypothetical protein
MVLAFRLPEQVDVPVTPPGTPESAPAGEATADQAAAGRASAGQAPGGQAPPTRPDMRRPTRPLPPGERPDAGAASPDAGAADGHAKGRHGRWRTLAQVGPVVSEAMIVNAVLRAFSGYMLFLLAFLLRSVDLGTVFGHPISHNFALGALALGLSVGSLASMILGSFFKGRAPQVIMFSVLIVAPVVTALCAWAFGLWTAVIVEATAIFCASLAKLAQDSIVGREIGDEIRSSTFAVSETLNQVANVAGGLAGVLVSMLNNGEAGLGIAAGGLAVAVVLLVGRRRKRVRAAATA